MSTQATVIPNSRTPASVVINVVNDGVIDVLPAQLSRYALLLQLREGPLKELLARTADWTVFNFMSNSAARDTVRFMRIEGGVVGMQNRPDATVLWHFLANSIEYAIFSAPGEIPVPSTLMVELRAVHSNER
jgi:hypothetical protein